jgi:hypothetical protein
VASLLQFRGNGGEHAVVDWETVTVISISKPIFNLEEDFRSFGGEVVVSYYITLPVSVVIDFLVNFLSLFVGHVQSPTFILYHDRQSQSREIGKIRANPSDLAISAVRGSFSLDIPSLLC